jgi:zinc-ribbon domain
MFCTKCGTDVPDDSRFCRSCGQMLGIVSTGAGAAAAVAPARSAEPGPKKTKHLGIKLVVLALLIGILWFIFSLAGKPTDLMKAAARMPIDLTNEVESVQAHSWRAIAIPVPYSGSLTISAHVQRGNPMMMFLTDGAGLEKLKTDNQNTYWGDFYAPKASTFQHTGRVNQGSYYFVLRDNTLGILSSSSSDVSVKARVEP